MSQEPLKPSERDLSKIILLCERLIKIGPDYRPMMNGWVNKYEKRRKILAKRLSAIRNGGK